MPYNPRWWTTLTVTAVAVNVFGTRDKDIQDFMYIYNTQKRYLPRRCDRAEYHSDQLAALDVDKPSEYYTFRLWAFGVGFQLYESVGFVICANVA